MFLIPRTTPWWTVAATTAVLLFAAGALCQHLHLHVWFQTPSGDALYAVLMGAVAGWTFWRDRERQLATLSGLEDGQQEAAWHAARAAPSASVPTDAAAHQGAVRLVEHHVEDFGARGLLSLGFYAVMVLLGVGLALGGSPGWVWLAVAALPAGAQVLWRQRRLRRRLVTLRASTPTAPGPLER